MSSSESRSALSAPVLLSMLIVYLVWGSTYLAIRLALNGYAPLFFPGLRFLFAGTVLYALLRLRGSAAPSLRQWRNAGFIGVLLLILGNGLVVLAERSVGSGLAATAVATVPLWTGLFARAWGEPTRLPQWIGLAVGFAGIVVLNLGAEFSASPLAAGLLAIAAISWSFGSLLARRIDMPAGLMGAACEMLVAGVLFLALSAAAGEHWQLLPSWQAFGALAYLAVFGSLIAFSAFVYVNQHTTPALSTSYAYVNPVIAVALGVLLGGERIAASGYVAMALVLAGVVLIVRFNRPPKPVAEPDRS